MSEWADDLAGELLAHYPGAFITEANVVALAEDLERVGTQEQASDVVALLRLRCKTVPTGADIAEVAKEVRQETMSPRQDLGYEPGRKLGPDDWAHGKYHLAELLSLPTDERSDEIRSKAYYPQRCGCEKRAAPDSRMWGIDAPRGRGVG